MEFVHSGKIVCTALAILHGHSKSGPSIWQVRILASAVLSRHAIPRPEMSGLNSPKNSHGTVVNNFLSGLHATGLIISID